MTIIMKVLLMMHRTKSTITNGMIHLPRNTANGMILLRKYIAYIMIQKSMDDLAVDLGIDYRSAVKRVYRIKKRLIEKVEPKLTVMNRRGA